MLHTQVACGLSFAFVCKYLLNCIYTFASVVSVEAFRYSNFQVRIAQRQAAGINNMSFWRCWWFTVPSQTHRLHANPNEFQLAKVKLFKIVYDDSWFPYFIIMSFNDGAQNAVHTKRCEMLLKQCAHAQLPMSCLSAAATTQRHLHTHIHTLCLAGYDTFIILHATFYFGDTSQSRRICVYILVYIYTHGDMCLCVSVRLCAQPTCATCLFVRIHSMWTRLSRWIGCCATRCCFTQFMAAANFSCRCW